MIATVPLQPLDHGVIGWWDEIINLTPVVIGALLLLYLYRASRRRKRQADEVDKQEHRDKL